MPKIEHPKVLDVLHNHYFDHHTAMHLSRERLKVYDPDRKPPGIAEVPPLLDPSHKCEDCKDMIEAGKKGSGREFLIMHHDMIRVFDYLLDKEGIDFGITWEHSHRKGEPSGSKWVRDCDGRPCYVPEVLWNVDDPVDLPQEIRALFSLADSHYLKEVYAGVRARVEHPVMYDGPVDELGTFIERGVKSGPAGGRGFHNTIHEYLGAREKKSATGAEMNKLRNSMYNDYFWSLHLWIDGQYGRLLENLGEKFETGRLAPGDPMNAMQDSMAAMHKHTHARIKAKRNAPADQGTGVLT